MGRSGGVIALTAIAAVSVGVAGCSSSKTGTGSGGGSPAPSSASSSASSSAASSSASSGSGGAIASLSADQIVTKASAALQAAKSVRVSGTQISGGQQLDLNVGFTETGTSGTITQGGTAIQIVVIGVVAYFKAPDSYWQKELAGNPNATAILEIVKGKWIKGPTTNARLKAFAEFTKDNFAKEVLQTSSVVSKAGTKQIDGVDAVGVNGKDSVLYVAADDARPLLIEPLAGSSDKGKIVFTEYGQVKEPTPPPAELTLDVTKLGG